MQLTNQEVSRFLVEKGEKYILNNIFKHVFGWKGVKNQEITGAGGRKMDELLITMIYTGRYNST